MLKRSKKRFALMLVLTMLATMFVGIGTASAATKNFTVGAVPNIASTGIYAGANIRVEEAAIGNFAVNDVITLTLTGAKFNAAPAISSKTGGTTAVATMVTNKVYNIKITAVAGVVDDYLNFTMPLNADSLGTGEITVNVVAPGTAIAEGTHVVAKFVSGSATASALSVSSRGGSGTLGTVRIIETAVGAVAAGETIILKLPVGYTWGATVLTASNGAVFAAPVGAGTRTLTYTCTAPGASRPGIFDITTPVVFGSDAKVGEINVSLSGTSDLVGDVLIGKYAEFSTNVTAKTAERAVVSAIDDQRIADVSVKEAIAASLVPGRTVTFILPENTRFNVAPVLTLSAGNNVWATAVTALSDQDRKATATLLGVASTTAADLQLKDVKIDVAANYEGKIDMVVGGTAGASGTVTVANASKIIKVTSEAKDVVVGTQAQQVGDIYITEGAKEAILAGGAPAEIITLDAPNGFTFAEVPTVEVIEGNFAIAKNGVTRTLNNTRVSITTDSQSTVASKIKVSNIKLTANRAVPEGIVEITIAGSAIMQNAPAFANVDNAGSVVVAKIVTPAPGEVKNNAGFVIGSTTYTINGVTNNMDVAPYITNGRTYMPIRYIANAMGIDNNNILWDAVNQTVTLMKGDKVVQLKIGTQTILINGAAVTMDVAPEITNSRTMLPARFVAQAFGAAVGWDEATQTVTLN